MNSNDVVLWVIYAGTCLVAIIIGLICVYDAKKDPEVDGTITLTQVLLWLIFGFSPVINTFLLAIIIFFMFCGVIVYIIENVTDKINVFDFRKERKRYDKHI